MKNKELILMAVAAFGVYYFMKNQSIRPGVTSSAGNDVFLPSPTVASIQSTPHHLRYQQSHSGRRIHTHAIV